MEKWELEKGESQRRMKLEKGTLGNGKFGEGWNWKKGNLEKDEVGEG